MEPDRTGPAPVAAKPSRRRRGRHCGGDHRQRAGATAARLAHVNELAGELRGESVCIASNGNGDPILVTDPGNDATLILQMPCVWPARSSQQAA